MYQSNQRITGKQVCDPLKQPRMQRVIITDIDDNKRAGDKAQTITIPKPSDIITGCVIRDILSKVYDIVLENKLTQRYLSSFSADFIKSCIGESINMHSSHAENQNPIQEQQQPENIKGDNMQPGSTTMMVEEKEKGHCDVEGSLKESAKSGTERVRRKLSTTSKYSRTGSNGNGQNGQAINKGESMNELVQINSKNNQITQLPEINDPYVEELRRLKQLNPKVDLTRKRDKKSLLGEKIKLLQKISYDFTGDIIKIKQIDQNSTLFTAPIQSIQNQGQITKNHDVTKPTDLDSHRAKRDRLVPKNPLTQHTNNISFSDIRSLTPHLEIIENARFIQGKTIVEKKKTKQPSLIDIKKSMSLNKISRTQFSKLKDITTVQKPFPLKASIPSLPSLKNQDSQLPTPKKNDKELTVRQSKYNRQQVLARQSERKETRSLPKSINGKKNPKITDRSYERVSVENEQLTEMLIDNKAQHWLDTHISVNAVHSRQELHQNTTNNSTPQLEQLTPRDIANLHYIKTAGTIGTLQLPKISSIMSNPNPLLQSKSKIKSKHHQNEIQRLKKHFEDKLRV